MLARTGIRKINKETDTIYEEPNDVPQKSVARSYFALAAGMCASGAGFAGKIAFGVVESPHVPSVKLNIWIVRSMCLTFMVSCNTLVWIFFVRALNYKGDTLKATVMCAATNFSLSFTLGAVLFQEKVTMNVVLGILLVLVGLMFITTGRDDEKNYNKVIVLPKKEGVNINEETDNAMDPEDTESNVDTASNVDDSEEDNANIKTEVDNSNVVHVGTQVDESDDVTYPAGVRTRNARRTMMNVGELE